ncbi:hypothetical protein BGX30_010186 [Mortierella sp. GBA39]|nr:hypothetical protein BGX30_010186 [Mortierella sp. GBA39]
MIPHTYHDDIAALIQSVREKVWRDGGSGGGYSMLNNGMRAAIKSSRVYNANKRAKALRIMDKFWIITEYLRKLDSQMATSRQKESVKALRKILESILGQHSGDQNAKVHVFGSFASGLCTVTSDVDFTVYNFARHYTNPIQEVAKAFRSAGCQSITAITNSRVPIVSFKARGFDSKFQTAPLGIKSLDSMHDIESRTAIVGTLASMIMHCQSQRHNYFQRVMGIFFHASNCSKDVINTLAKAHICISYDSTLAAVGSLTEDAISIVREAVLKNNWYIIYDNINFESTMPIPNQVSTAAEAIRTQYLVRPEANRKTYGNANTNAALFIRDILVYIELGDAIKQGDVGRIEAVLVPITVMFQAGGTKNYPNQLLRLAFDIRHSWTKLRTDAIFSS